MGNQLCNIFPDCGSGGKTGRFDSGTVKEAGSILCLTNCRKSPPASEARRPCKRGNCQITGQGRNAEPSFFHNVSKSCLGGIDGLFIGKVSAVGPTNRFPWTVGLTKMPLAHLSGKLKDRMGNEGSGFLSRSWYSPRRGVIESLWALT